jgi:hypothetical protein
MGQIREIAAAGRRSWQTAAARLTRCANKGHHKLRVTSSARLDHAFWGIKDARDNDDYAWSGAAEPEAPRSRRPATPRRCRVSLCSVRMAIARGGGQRASTRRDTMVSTQRGAGMRQAPRGLQGAVAHVPFSRLPGNLDSCFASLCKTLLCSARRVVAADLCVKCQGAPLKWRESARSN